MIDPAVHAAHLIRSFSTIARVLVSVSVGMGVCLFVSGIMQLKRYGEMRTMMSHQMTLWGPLSVMFAGVFCLVLPFFISSSLLAFWGTSNPLHYGGSGDNLLDQYVPAVNMFVRVIGIGAILRAISLFARAGGHNSQPGSLSRGIFYLFSGVLCVHIVGSAHLFKAIFDFT